jgi:glycerol-3-phosphate acyltransferase PlsY
VVLTPVGWVATVLAASVLGGADGDDRGVAGALGSLAVNALALVAPTVAVLVAVAALRQGERAAGVARAVAVGLYVLSLVLVPLLVTSFSVPWLIAVFAAELVLWIEWQRGGADLPGAAGGPGSAGGGAG